MSAPFDTITTNKFAGYGMRKLATGWAGNCFLCRRSSDNTTQAIGFDGSGNVDVSGFNTFIGAGNGFVQTWYDQSGNGNDLTQTSNSLQPQVILNATQNNRPTARFNGSSTYLINTALATNGVASLTACSVFAPKAYVDNTGVSVFDDTPASLNSDFANGWVIILEATTSGIQAGSKIKNGLYLDAQANTSSNAYQQVTAWLINNATNTDGIVINGGSANTASSSNFTATNIATAQLAFGARITNGNQIGNYGQVDICEFACWSADNSASGTRGPVETDQQNYYTIAAAVSPFPAERGPLAKRVMRPLIIR